MTLLGSVATAGLDGNSLTDDELDELFSVSAREGCIHGHMDELRSLDELDTHLVQHLRDGPLEDEGDQVRVGVDRESHLLDTVVLHTHDFVRDTNFPARNDCLGHCTSRVHLVG